jgi:hypothetical protein
MIDDAPRYLLTWRVFDGERPTVAEVLGTLATPLTHLLAIYIDDDTRRGWTLPLVRWGADEGIDAARAEGLREFLARQEPGIEFVIDVDGEWTFE